MRDEGGTSPRFRLVPLPSEQDEALPPAREVRSFVRPLEFRVAARRRLQPSRGRGDGQRVSSTSLVINEGRVDVESGPERRRPPRTLGRTEPIAPETLPGSGAFARDD
jgi:hypothetical protein